MGTEIIRVSDEWALSKNRHEAKAMTLLRILA